MRVALPAVDHRAVTLALTLVAFAIGGAACGGDVSPTPREVTPAPAAGTPPPSLPLSTPSPSPSPAALAVTPFIPPPGFWPHGARTGIAAVDGVIEALEGRDAAALRHVAGLAAIPCLKDGNVPCLGSESDGTVVEVFVLGGCAHASAVRSVEYARTAVASLGRAVGYLYGATWFTNGWVVPEGYELLWGTQLDSTSNLMLLVDESGRVVGVERYGCGFDPFGDWVFAPPRLDSIDERSLEIERAWLKLHATAETIVFGSCGAPCKVGVPSLQADACRSLEQPPFESQPGYAPALHGGWLAALRAFCAAVAGLEDRTPFEQFRAVQRAALQALDRAVGRPPEPLPPLPPPP